MCQITICQKQLLLLLLYAIKIDTPGAMADETWYSDPEFCEQRKDWYRISKTLAEQAAWKFAKENGIDLVTLHPGLVIGPLLQPTLNYSCEVIVNVIKEETQASAFDDHNFLWTRRRVSNVQNKHVLSNTFLKNLIRNRSMVWWNI